MCGDRCVEWGGVGWVFTDTTIAERVCHAIVYFIQSHSSPVLSQHITDPDTGCLHWEKLANARSRDSAATSPASSPASRSHLGLTQSKMHCWTQSMT